MSLIKAQNITKKYGEFTALNNVSLEIHENEIVSLLGINGAGKTTLSSIIASLHPPTSGDVLLHNTSIYNDLIEYRRQVGFCPQQQNLGTLMTVKEHLLFAGRFFLMPKQQIQQRAEELIEYFGLGKYVDKNPSILSGGYKQRLQIARALIHNPKLLILDEPTVALDAHIRQRMWEVIKGLKEQGVSILLTTHYIDEAEKLSDRVCVLHSGKIQLIDTPQALMSSYSKTRLEDVFIQLVNEQQKEQEGEVL